MFTNLLNNAVQAIDVHQEGKILIHLTRELHQIIVIVADNGCGIPPEQKERIFQPEFTTKTGGMGLGLAIVKGIAEGMNGTISFTSEEQKGTSFILNFPEYGKQISVQTK
jgi:signal transduction histidine kinase